MTSFYTSVERHGGNILWRGYENGKAFGRKVKYEPTMFIASKNPTDWKTMVGGKYLSPKRFDSMYDCKDFIEQYKDVAGFDVHGNTNYVAQFIQEQYPGEIKFDPSLINIFSFDIEVDISANPIYKGEHKIKVRKRQKQ